jgi:sigma-B regulation protein RsbQ
MLVSKDALNARMAGRGPDVLVLVHGFGSDQRVWDSYVPWLSRHCRVITYDLPFSGDADPAYFELRRHGTIDGNAQDLLDILNSFGVERCSLMGHSLGGLIGLFAAIERPKLFDQLILLGTSGRYLDGPGYKGGLTQEQLDASFAVVAENFRAWAESYAPVATGRPLKDPTSLTFLGSLLRTRPDITVAMARPIFLGDYREHVKQCTTPVLLLQTREDPSVPMEAALSLQQCLKNSTLEIIDTIGHLPHLSAAEAVADALRRHLPCFQERPKIRLL